MSTHRRPRPFAVRAVPALILGASMASQAYALSRSAAPRVFGPLAEHPQDEPALQEVEVRELKSSA